MIPFRELTASVLDFLFPPICIVCEDRIETGLKWVCTSCWKNLKHVEGLVEKGIIERSSIDKIRSGYYYDDALHQIIHQLKYHHGESLADRLAEKLCEVIAVDEDFQNAGALVAIPLNPIKLRERGYNQSNLLAEAISKRTGIPNFPDALKRTRNTVSQTTMDSAQDRVKNMNGAFVASADVKGKSLILLDDLITTGSTANACAYALKQAGADKVLVLTAGRPTLN